MTHGPANTPEIINHWEYPIEPTPGSDLYNLLRVIDLENQRLNLEIEELYENRFLESATGTELEKIGGYVGVQRKTDEGNDKLRKRIQAEFLAQASDTTYETFSAAALSILETTPQSIEITTPPELGPKTVGLTVDGGVIEESPLGVDELVDLLDRTVSADATVQLTETGTFAFDGDDDSLEGWDTGTWSSTID